jgi:hypothetical protein
MHCIPDPHQRDEFVKGLRALARYLTAHPDIPVPDYGSDILLHADSDQDGGFAQVDRVASLLRAPVTDDTASDGHYRATRSFGPVSYTVVSIPEARMARVDAYMSYRDSVIPDTSPAARSDA